MLADESINGVIGADIGANRIVLYPSSRYLSRYSQLRVKAIIPIDPSAWNQAEVILIIQHGSQCELEWNRLSNLPDRAPSIRDRSRLGI